MRRGYAAIGLHNSKNDHNIGGALRAAFCYDAKLVALCGRRMYSYSTDTTKAWRHIPLIRTNDLLNVCPYDAIPVAVEILEDSISLPDFIHPERAFYIFGPEENSIPPEVVARCEYKVSIPTTRCMNLASTVNVVLYDRLCKELRHENNQQAHRLL
jgi:tRNA(Leu) C34 or U34 (ribose-2'-O)-methylase TrmL